MLPPLLPFFALLVGVVSVTQTEADGGRSRVRRYAAGGDAAGVVAPDAGVDEAANVDAVLSRLEKLEQLFSSAQRQNDVMFSHISSHLDNLVESVAAISPVPVLGGRCRRDEDCSNLRSDTVCSKKGQCVCREGLQEVAGDVCRPRQRLSHSCRRGADCGDDHSACHHNVCVCASGYVSDNDELCRRPRLSEACHSYRDCQGVGTVCGPGVCVCRPEFWNDGNVTCRPRPRLNEACNVTADCNRTRNAVCADNVCACSAGYYQQDSGFIDGPQFCARGARYDEECYHDGACNVTSKRMACDNGVCKCAPANKDGFRPGEGSLRLDSPGCQSGFIEISEYFHGWSPYFICRNLTEADATVFCRGLHFSRGRPQTLEIGEVTPYSLRYLGGGRFSGGNAEFSCSGSEETIDECDWSPPGSCDPSEVRPVRVECFAN